MTIRRHLEPSPGATGPLEILEPYLWVHTLGGGSTVEGVVKVPAKLPEERARDAAAVRRLLLEQAERAMAAMEEAGYAHDRHPEFTISGDIARYDGEEFPRAEATLRLFMKRKAEQ